MVNKIQDVRTSLFEFLSDRQVLIILTIAPALILFTFVSIVPIVWSIATAFHYVGVFDPVWEWAGLENFKLVLGDPAFWDSVWKSTLYAIFSIAGQVGIGTGLALLLNREFKFSRGMRALAMLPYMVPTAVLGLVALWMGNSSWGVVNQIPVQMGLISEPINYFGSTESVLFGLTTVNMIAVAIVGWWKWSAFVLIFVLARLQSIPDELYEAAKICGATKYQLFRDITLPNLKGVLFILIFLRGIWMFNKFDVIFVLTQGGPVETTRIAPIFAYETAFDYGNLGEAGAIATLLFGILLVFGILYLNIFNPEEEVQVE
jgi:multiple sugar transport system permease protein